MLTSSAFKKSIFFGFHIFLIAVVSFVYLFGRSSHSPDVLGVSADTTNSGSQSQFANTQFLNTDITESTVLKNIPISEQLTGTKDLGLLFSGSNSTTLTLPNTGLLENNKLPALGIGLAFLADSYLMLRFRRGVKPESRPKSANSYQLFNLQQS